MALTKVGRLIDKGVIKDQTNLGTQAADTDEYLLYDASADALKSIAASNVTPNETLITGKDALGTGAASDDLVLIYDTSAGVLKKVTQTNLLNFPTVSSVSPTSVTSGDGTGNYTFTITGSGFTAGTASLINDSGSSVSFDSQTVDSDTQITGVIAKSSLPGSGEPYDVKVAASTGLSSTLDNQINIDQQPAFSTASGSLGSVSDSARSSASFTVVAADPESGGDVVYTLESGSLPAGCSLTSTSSGAVLSGFNAVGTNTTSTFTIRAKDVNSNTSDREFTITVLAPVQQSFTSSGTFSVPSGVTSVNVLVVGGGGGGGYDFGGGGGAGGLIYRPGFPVTPGGTVTVTVGSGGPNSPGSGSPGGTGQDSVFGTLTAKGGGGGAAQSAAGISGGSGGGAGKNSPRTNKGDSIQPTQPGDSGTYGFGNPGGVASTNTGNGAAGGGGGAGAAGADAQPGDNQYAGQGGAGKAYTIADGTTSVYYAGGGGGGSQYSTLSGQGGNGGGGSAANDPAQPVNGHANRGGGGGGGPQQCQANGGAGGKGIVIVSY